MKFIPNIYHHERLNTYVLIFTIKSSVENSLKFLNKLSWLFRVIIAKRVSFPLRYMRKSEDRFMHAKKKSNRLLHGNKPHTILAFI